MITLQTFWLERGDSIFAFLSIFLPERFPNALSGQNSWVLSFFGQIVFAGSGQLTTISHYIIPFLWASLYAFCDLLFASLPMKKMGHILIVHVKCLVGHWCTLKLKAKHTLLSKSQFNWWEIWLHSTSSFQKWKMSFQNKGFVKYCDFYLEFKFKLEMCKNLKLPLPPKSPSFMSFKRSCSFLLLLQLVVEVGASSDWGYVAFGMPL